ncbi:hypothetical protein RO21_07225 [[Actinobacillus] muris]|uniref:Uncharacterized protein n=1 Tax=Muribacter muris TaxID=67855 RepID=A0A0J5S397_9PAST|nr:hypothetical protein [Muribacter muris]KMK51247.1 hypothetical protein RO21_07225 [[Actinobacillus] muris] [Muribacter muris]
MISLIDAYIALVNNLPEGNRQMECFKRSLLRYKADYLLHKSDIPKHKIKSDILQGIYEFPSLMSGLFSPQHLNDAYHAYIELMCNEYHFIIAEPFFQRKITRLANKKSLNNINQIILFHIHQNSSRN